jgi:transcriptional regulator with XRE-family HTH domain
MSSYEAVVGELRATAARRRISQKKLAARLGHNQQWLSRRLNGDVTLDLREFVELCDVLGASPAKLWAEAEEHDDGQDITRRYHKTAA